MHLIEESKFKNLYIKSTLFYKQNFYFLIVTIKYLFLTYDIYKDSVDQ